MEKLKKPTFSFLFFIISTTVLNAQEKYAKTEKNVAIVRNTGDCKYSDTWHWDSDRYIDLGEKFAEAIYHLNKN
jgi:hypothetical protein